MTIANLTPRGRTRTAHEYVLDALRSAILGGSLAGGTRLVQTELAAQLNVSTTPVREALRDLATEGLVFFDPHRGAIVRTLDLPEVREIYELRITLEPLMVRRTIDRITDETLDHAAELAQRMQNETNLSTWVDLNREFHATFTEIDKGSRLATILASLRDSASAYVSLSLEARPQQVPDANHEHAELMRRYRNRDTDGVVELTLRHLRSTLDAIEKSHRRGTS